MRLLIVTQVVDRTDPTLGFFHDWIEECASRVQSLEVICLRQGHYQFGKNVTVYSLGKESGTSRFRQLLRWYWLVWYLRRRYDAVLVHMNPLYVVLAGPLWRVLHKRIGLWYTHGTVSGMLRAAVWWTDYVFTATQQSMRIDTRKRIVLGHGIQVPHTGSAHGAFSHDGILSLVTIGRISPAKDLVLLIDAVTLLVKKNVPVTLAIVGAPITPADHDYDQALRAHVADNQLAEVMFVGPVKHEDIGTVLGTADLFVSASRTGSLDKAILEAVLAGVPVLTTNEGAKEVFAADAPDMIIDTPTAEGFARQILAFRARPAGLRRESIRRMQRKVANEHTLPSLIERMLPYLDR